MPRSSHPDIRGEWRSRLRAINGQTLADSGEGYRNRNDCLHAIELIRRGAGNAPVIG
jgi:uncharacterized protein YegP (UPF0339 family)